MFSSIFLPWWGWGYLLFVLTMFVMGFFSEERLNMHELVGSALSLFSISIFVLGFFNPALVSFFGVFLFPMVMMGLYWEFTRAIRETGYAVDELAHERDLDQGERDFLLNIAVGFNAAVVVPGYMIGITLCINLVRGYLGA